jgi:PhnB protein
MPESPMDRLEQALASMPRAAFRARLRAELERTAAMTTTMSEPQVRVRRRATPLLRVANAAAAIDFYVRAFDAREVMRFEAGGRVPHAEIEIGDSLIMLGDEAPDYGFPGPQKLGGSPVGMHLRVDDADAAIAHAVEAGATLIEPATDQFYGDRSGRVSDPFGYTWTIAMRREEMSVGEMQQRMAAMMAQREPRTAASYRREGFRTVTPYVVVPDAPGLIDFTTRAFGAEQTMRTEFPGGGVHAEARIGDSMLMIGAPSAAYGGQRFVTAFHLYVPDCDAACRRAVDAGATLIQAPVDQPYGERGGAVRDAVGNTWYVATAHGPHYVPERLHTLNVYLHPHRAEPLLAFLVKAFGADEIEKVATPDGIVMHAHARIGGDSVVEMGEARGEIQPMPTMFYLYVPDADASYYRAMNAGAASVHQPADQPYGDRTAAVRDAFGNVWYLATHVRDTA